MAQLTLDDIVDLRAYEKERDELRRQVIALKKIRRVSVGPVATFVFECRQTIRFQVQEMARAEKISTDSGITAELDVYNPLIPTHGHLSATLFLELTSDDQLRKWLPKLVGIETASYFEVGTDTDRWTVPCLVDPDHAKQLSRDETTASVHYVSFSFTDQQVTAFADGAVTLGFHHPAYEFTQKLSEATKTELLTDLRG